jgi:hypothetical protein
MCGAPPGLNKLPGLPGMNKIFPQQQPQSPAANLQTGAAALTVNNTQAGSGSNAAGNYVQNLSGAQSGTSAAVGPNMLGTSSPSTGTFR